MKRSEAIEKLQRFVISPHEVISHDAFQAGIYRDRAERLLKFIEVDLGMQPPAIGWTGDETIYDWDEE